jgi:hypothetical protein
MEQAQPQAPVQVLARTYLVLGLEPLLMLALGRLLTPVLVLTPLLVLMLLLGVAERRWGLVLLIRV